MYDSIIIGCGQAGLAIAYYLKKANQNFLLIDKRSEIGETWKERYDSLTLFTPRLYNSLPGLPFSGEKHGFPDKIEVADYLKKYAEMFEFPIHLKEEVIHVKKTNDSYLIMTRKGEYKAKHVIVATGPFQTPNIPSIANELSNSIYQIHSSQYKNPSQLVNGGVLVVGGGNSGAQIAVELSKKKDTYLAVSRKLSSFPLIIGKKSTFWWFKKLGILSTDSHSFLGKIIQKKGDFIFGSELKNAVRRNEVKVKKRVIAAKENELIFADDTTLQVNNIIWATGFKTELPWLKIDGVFDHNGNIRHDRGVANMEGLYFIGLPWQSRRGSALLQGVGYDAKYIAEIINGKFSRSAD
ncbi:flavin-containing monooxygenase [Gracilibacillus xinjiangensis]|uniref:Flavin-containing monooxygenase n=1 Tax=Gracilibacillus xinjiangensis TaxID=1193282 RepID=A0ABV8WXP5_9BACI